MSDKFKMEEGSGNVFADLGLPNAEERLVQAEIIMQSRDSIMARRLQSDADRRAALDELAHLGQLIGIGYED